MRGWQEWGKYTPEGLEKGIAYIEQAIKKDPGHAASYAALGDCYCWAALQGLMAPIAVFPKARAAATRALELDETLAEAHAALGAVTYMFNWDFRGAEREFKRAVELNPSSASAHAQYGLYLIFREGLDLDPHLGYLYAHLAWVYARKGMRSEAIAIADKARSLLAPGKDLAFDAFLAEVYVESGRRAEVQSWVESWEHPPTEHYVDGYVLAFLHFLLGNRDRAFQWLNKAYEDRSASLPGLQTDPWWDTLRPDPRFQELVRGVGFPE